MSRWTERFANHQFHKSWGRVKVGLKDAKVNDETVVTDVEELGRLKRVVSFIDGLLGSLDPELVPISVWDNFSSQSDACAQQIEAFNNSKSIAHVQAANEHADNLLTYVRPYMVVTGRQAKNLRDSAAEYIRVLDEYSRSFVGRASGKLDEISERLAAVNNAAEQVRVSKEFVDFAVVEMLGEVGSGSSGSVGKFKAEYDEFAAKYGELSDFHKEVFGPQDGVVSIRERVQSVVREVSQSADQAKESLRNSKSIISELSEFYDKVFGVPSEDEGRTGGLDKEIDLRKSALDEFEDEQNRRYIALNAQIESLLPGAASAGLASAYSQMKGTFDAPLRSASRLFYASIALIVIVALVSMTQKVWLFGIEFSPIGDLSSVIRGVLYKLPLIGPLVWLAFYASRRRSECQRLQQEYAHKEALAKSYDSYKKQIVELGGDRAEMLASLIAKAVDAVAFNASTTLDGRHGDKLPLQTVIDKLLDKVPNA